jgi:hypothetical protein
MLFASSNTDFSTNFNFAQNIFLNISFRSASLLAFPTGESDPVERLRLCDTEFARVKSSILPVFFTTMRKIIFSFPNFIIPWILRTNVLMGETPMTMTIFPLSHDPMEFEGHPFYTAVFHTNPEQLNSGNIISYENWNYSVALFYTKKLSV